MYQVSLSPIVRQTRSKSSCPVAWKSIGRHQKENNDWEDHLVVQAELKLCVHGADLDGEDLAHLLPPEHQVVQRHL